MGLVGGVDFDDRNNAAAPEVRPRLS